MSFDVFVQCCGETAKSGLPRERVRSLFPVSEKDSDQERWVVKCGEDDSADVYVDAEGTISDFMVNRPAGDVRFWEALLTVLRMGSVVMYWPGSPPLLALKSNVEPLPPDFTAALGEPVFVERAEEFFELLKIT
jgi:hypothetical protein